MPNGIGYILFRASETRRDDAERIVPGTDQLVVRTWSRGPGESTTSSWIMTNGRWRSAVGTMMTLPALVVR
jgi:hypothetical protein